MVIFNFSFVKIFSGRVVTGANVGLGDVLVTIKDEDDTVIFHHLTAPDGTYTSPPIKSGPNYKYATDFFLCNILF